MVHNENPNNYETHLGKLGNYKQLLRKSLQFIQKFLKYVLHNEQNVNKQTIISQETNQHSMRLTCTSK